MRHTFAVTSALLFVALLMVVDFSYRRWMRRSIERRLQVERARRRARLDDVVVLEDVVEREDVVVRDGVVVLEDGDELDEQRRG